MGTEASLESSFHPLFPIGQRQPLDPGLMAPDSGRSWDSLLLVGPATSEF